MRTTLPLLHDLSFRDHQTDGQAGAQALGQGHDVRLHIPVLTGEHLRSEEHTSELQSHHDLVCRLLLEKKKKIKKRWICSEYSSRSIASSYVRLYTWSRYI